MQAAVANADFASLGLGEGLAAAAAGLGWQAPTALQSAAIPALLRGTDLQLEAEAGGGKTAACALALLQRLSERAAARSRRKLQALWLVPTREQALAAFSLCSALAQGLAQPPRIALLHDGAAISSQLLALRCGADLAIATPGRLIEVVDHEGLQLEPLRLLALDDAAELLGNCPQTLQQLLDLLPEQRQTLLLSRGGSAALQRLADALLRAPVRLRLAAALSEPAVELQAFEVEPQRRAELLRALALQLRWRRALVFVSSQQAAEQLAAQLCAQGLCAVAVNGALTQRARSELVSSFSAGRWNLIVATDAAARQLDFDSLPVVVHYDAPRHAADCLQRLACGAGGVSLSLVTANNRMHWEQICHKLGLQIELQLLPGYETSEAN